MEIVVVLLIGVPLALAVWLVGRVKSAGDSIAVLTERQDRLEQELAQLKEELTPASPPVITARPPAARAPVASTQPPVVAPSVKKWPGRRETERPAPPSLAPSQPAFATAAATKPPTPPLIAEPPPLPAPPPQRKASFPDQIAWSNLDWEQFMGVKLFAWIGGLALFLGVAFFVRYAFEHDLIPAQVRIALGYLAGVGLLGAGTLLHRRKQYTVGAQTLCGTGVVILYATTFACRSLYHFIGTVPAFLLMVLITTTAFLLAVRLNALVVAILGLCGGFLTPVLLSTGEDNPLGLFGYIALLDAGLLAVALNRRWNFLTLLAAAGTVLMQLGWTSEFFVREKYFEGNQVLVAFAVFVGFSVMFTAAWDWARRRVRSSPWLTASTLLMPAAAMVFGFYLLNFESLGDRPGLVFGYVLLIDLCALALVWLDETLARVQLSAGVTVFLLLTVWTLRHLSNELLNWALGLYLVFAILHAVLPFVLQRLRPGVTPVWWGHLFPLLALLLMLAPIFKLDGVSLVLWPFMLLVDLLVIILAVLSASVLWILGALVLTLIAAGCWIIEAPPQLTMLPEELVVIGGFAIVFFAAGIFAARRLASTPADAGAVATPNGAATPGPFGLSLASDTLLPQVPAMSALLPFVLLILVTTRLPLADPSPVFGLALLLGVLLLGLTRLFPVSWLPAVGLGCVFALEHNWHFRHFNPDAAVIPLLWYLGFTVLFAGFPFVFWRRFTGQIVPWATAALAGPLHFYLVHRLVKAAWPNEFMGLLPLAFALPSVAGLVFLIRSVAADAPKRLSLLAWFGGAALFFITLIFPIQFDRQWITLGWALEGAALLWLFHRVPHAGLRLTGVGLLVTAFVRLALNPAVLEYHVRSSTAIFNWYLYTYGVATACLFIGARLLAPPRHLVLGSNAPALLATLGTVLAFLLLNLEIADYFTAPGSTALAFQFSGDLARDMTYSIAWAVFALGLVVAGIARRIRAARWAGIALLCVTLAKLFLHDLASLGQLYRIGAFLGVAVIAIAASFLYQRFLAADVVRNEPPSENQPPAV